MIKNFTGTSLALLQRIIKYNKIELISGALQWKIFLKIKHLKSLQKAEVYLEPMRLLRGSFFVNILSGFIFPQYKLHHRSSTGLHIGLWKYWDFQSEAKVEQIIAIVTTTHSVSCSEFKCLLIQNFHRLGSVEEWFILGVLRLFRSLLFTLA